MTLSDSINNDPTTVFLSSDDFAESIVYVPHTHFGATARANRTINAVVIRYPVEDEEGVVTHHTEIRVHNNSTTGISSDELDLGGDAVQLAPRDGEIAETRQITRLLSIDSGMLSIEVK
jgi:hypothetical protein